KTTHLDGVARSLQFIAVVSPSLLRCKYCEAMLPVIGARWQGSHAKSHCVRIFEVAIPGFEQAAAATK
ncbi:hypothetical protein ABTA89_19855, partial [Acinetobacter baumannii]